MIRELTGTHSVVNTVRAVLISVHVGLLSILSADWFFTCCCVPQTKATLLLLFLLTKLFFLNALYELGASLHSHLQQCQLFLGFFSSSAVR